MIHHDTVYRCIWKDEGARIVVLAVDGVHGADGGASHYHLCSSH